MNNQEESRSNLEIDLVGFSKETLIELIIFANERNLTFARAIEEILKHYLLTDE